MNNDTIPSQLDPVTIPSALAPVGSAATGRAASSGVGAATKWALGAAALVAVWLFTR